MESVCVAEVIFQLLRGQWAPSLIAVIGEHGPIHFLAITRAVPGISRKVLTEQLRFLEGAGVISRSASDERSEVFYEMTSKGNQLKAAMDGLNDIAQRWPSL